jgi:hypothetical protein
MRLPILAAAAALIVTAAATPASALGVISGADLRSDCDHGLDTCGSYISGAGDAIADINNFLISSNNKGLFCPPAAGVSHVTLTGIVVTYLHDHPESATMTASNTVEAAIFDFFPCRK